MYTIHDERDSSLLRNGLAVGITSLFLLMAGVVFGNYDDQDLRQELELDRLKVEIAH